MANRASLKLQTPPSILALLERRQLDMRPVLLEAEKLLPDLLRDSSSWCSMYIDYHPPHLMRLYHQLGLVRINLHYFMPVDAGAAVTDDPRDINLYHPHPWAAAFRILEGRYGQYFGQATQFGTENPPPRREPIVVQDARDPEKNLYAMNDPLQWHQVIPFADGKSVTTLMVTHIPDEWGQKPAPPEVLQRELDQTEKAFMLDHFSQIYAQPNYPETKPPVVLGGLVT